jgi:tetratricopeptide (TPR) repeat protein
VEELRRQIEQQQRDLELGLRDDWIAAWETVARSARQGRSVEALEAARALPAPPRLQVLRPEWPQLEDLFAAIGTALVEQVPALGPPRLQDPEQVQAEQRMAAVAAELRELLTVPPTREDAALASELDRLAASLASRAAAREELRALRQHEDLRGSQNALLADARAAAAARRPSEAVALYERLFALDGDSRVRQALEDEFTAAETRADALERARAASLRGDGARALAILDRHMGDDAAAWALPIRIESEPLGAEVLRAGEVLGSTPLELLVLPEEQVELRLHAPEHLQELIRFRGPHGQQVTLSRTPERSWSTASAVDAIPVPLGDDHLVADRAGQLARVRTGGQVAWSARVDDLSGIERAPVHLPARPERMLLVTEGGQAYTLDPEDGTLAGPALIGTPVAGPTPGPSVVQVRVSGDRFALFHDGHKPTWITGPAPLADENTVEGPTSGMRVLRPLEGQQDIHRSPFGEWSVSFAEGVWRAKHPRHADFTARGSGRWRWFAFESRRGSDLLWVSDEAGLRAWSLAD